MRAVSLHRGHMPYTARGENMRGSEAYGEGGVLAALRALALGARSEFSSAAAALLVKR